MPRLVRIAVVLALVVSFGAIGQVAAQASSSTNYQVNEVQFGSGSSLDDCSASYCAKTSAGDLTVGTTGSTNYKALAGFNTNDEALLEVSVVNAGNTDLGVLDPSTTGKLSAVVKVRSYLSNGYGLYITGSSPKYGNHALTPMSTTAVSQAGTEQFGINFAANTSPSIGAAPVQVPDSTFSYGTVASGYSTVNQFKYVDGDMVASSATESGETDYTLSMILNISNVTPAGQYVGAMSAVVVGYF
jgi:hypothetical protein